MSGAWTLGRLFVLRHAGFPFDWIEELGLSAGTVARLDALLEAEARLVSGLPDPRQAAEALRLGREPRRPKGAGTDEAWSAFKAALEALTAAWSADRDALRARLHARAGDEGIQGAVFLSNPSVYENSWRRYATQPLRPDNSDARRLDRQAYTYLQRLCAKNETTSFFGPMGYGEILDDDRVQVAVVPSGSTRRRTFLAFWAVTELCKVIQKERAFRHELPLRLNPMFVREGTAARCEPLGLSATLDGLRSGLVELLQGRGHTFTTAAAALRTTPEALEREAIPLLKCAYLLRGLPFATNGFDTLESLTAAVEALPPSEPRSLWLERLGTFARLLTEFAGGALEQRRRLLAELEAHFTALTGLPARRGEGKVYEDRLVIYEEASSPFALQFGRAFGQRLAESLSGALQISAGYGEQIQRGYQAEVARELGTSGELDFLGYSLRTRKPEVQGTRFSPVPPLPVEDEGRLLRLPPERLPWGGPGARYALPDVCLGGTLPEAPSEPPRIEILLARVHHHLLLYSWLAAFHPEPKAFSEVARRFVASEPGVKGLLALSVRRRNKGFYVYPGRALLQTVTDANDVASQALGPLEVKVRLTPDGPRLLGPGGEPLALYFPLDDLSKYPPFAALSHPLVLHAPFKADGGHTPRVQLGGAYYQRERWEVATAELAGLSGLPFHLQIHRIRRRLGMPRFVYGRTPIERKPYLFDLESPFAMELLRHVVDGAPSVTFEEMWPAPDQLFLRDERGRYTFELRMQAERWTTAG